MKKPRKYEEALPVQFRRNPSYWRSVWLGLRASLWFMPLTFVRAVRNPIAAIIISVFQLAVQLAVWAFARVCILLAALCGMISEKKK